MLVLKFFMSMIWGIFWASLGLLVGLTVVGIPLAVILLCISGYPFYRTMVTALRMHEEWQHRPHPMYKPGEVEIPWETFDEMESRE